MSKIKIKYNISFLLTSLMALAIGLSFGSIFESIPQRELSICFSFVFLAGFFLGIGSENMFNDIYKRISIINERRTK